MQRNTDLRCLSLSFKDTPHPSELLQCGHNLCCILIDKVFCAIDPGQVQKQEVYQWQGLQPGLAALVICRDLSLVDRVNEPHQPLKGAALNAGVALDGLLRRRQRSGLQHLGICRLFIVDWS